MSKLDSTCNSLGLAPGCLRMFVMKCLVRDGGVSAPCHLSQKSLHAGLQRHQIFLKEADFKETIARFAKLGRSDRHRVANVIREQLDPPAEIATVQQLRFAIEKPNHLAVEQAMSRPLFSPIV